MTIDPRSRLTLLPLAALLTLILPACQTRPDYSRPLPPGSPALVRVPPEQWPVLSGATLRPDPDLLKAAERSRRWFALPSTVAHFPRAGISHEQARLSTEVFEWMMRQVPGGRSLSVAALQREFDLYQSVGWDGQGTVLFTGYYAPEFTASWTRTGAFQHPLHRLPPQLIKPQTPDEPAQWRRADGAIVTPPTRAQLERQNLLSGHELLFLPDALSAYLIHVQGSARLRMTDGSVIHIGYAGDNGHDYVSLAQELIKDRQISADQAGLPAIRQYFERYPTRLTGYLQRNPRFIFFQVYDSGNWPAGSLGFPVTAWRSLATDKRIFPRGMPMLVDTRIPSATTTPRRFRQFMFDQDTGGVIRAPGRADIFMGIGLAAESIAGRQKHEGSMYYLVLKPERMAVWRDFFRQAQQPGSAAR